MPWQDTIVEGRVYLGPQFWRNWNPSQQEDGAARHGSRQADWWELPKGRTKQREKARSQGRL